MLSCRVDGVKQVAAVAVGEKHSLALQCWRTAPAISLFDAASPSNSAPLSPSADQQLTSPRTASTISPVQQLVNSVIYVMSYYVNKNAWSHILCSMRAESLLPVLVNMQLLVVGQGRAGSALPYVLPSGWCCASAK